MGAVDRRAAGAANMSTYSQITNGADADPFTSRQVAASHRRSHNPVTQLSHHVADELVSIGMNSTVAAMDWEIWQTAQRLSRRTISERLRVICLLHAETGQQPISIDSAGIVRWIADHGDDWSDSTACTYTSYLSAWFKWLQLTDRRMDNPMVKVGTPRPPDREPRPVSDPDVVKLLQSRMWNSTRRMILLALLAGLRVHEIAKVRGEDFDLGARLLWVRGKG